MQSTSGNSYKVLNCEYERISGRVPESRRGLKRPSPRPPSTTAKPEVRLRGADVGGNVALSFVSRRRGGRGVWPRGVRDFSTVCGDGPILTGTLADSGNNGDRSELVLTELFLTRETDMHLARLE
jgi:hypothetical protein